MHHINHHRITLLILTSLTLTAHMISSATGRDQAHIKGEWRRLVFANDPYYHSTLPVVVNKPAVKVGQSKRELDDNFLTSDHEKTQNQNAQISIPNEAKTRPQSKNTNTPVDLSKDIDGNDTVELQVDDYTDSQGFDLFDLVTRQKNSTELELFDALLETIQEAVDEENRMQMQNNVSAQNISILPDKFAALINVTTDHSDLIAINHAANATEEMIDEDVLSTLIKTNISDIINKTIPSQHNNHTSHIKGKISNTFAYPIKSESKNKKHILRIQIFDDRAYLLKNVTKSASNGSPNETYTEWEVICVIKYNNLPHINKEYGRTKQMYARVPQFSTQPRNSRFVGQLIGVAAVMLYPVIMSVLVLFFYLVVGVCKHFKNGHCKTKTVKTPRKP